MSTCLTFIKITQIAAEFLFVHNPFSIIIDCYSVHLVLRLSIMSQEGQESTSGQGSQTFSAVENLMDDHDTPRNDTAPHNAFSRLRNKGLLELFTLTKVGASDFDAECLKCGRFTKKEASSRLVEHIRTCYSDLEILNQVLAEHEAYERQQLAKKSASLEKNAASDKTKIANDLVLTFIGQNALPFSSVDSSSFKELVSFLDPKYKPPSAWAVATKLAPARSMSYESQLRQEIDSIDDFTLTIEFDPWSSNSGMSVLAIVLTRPSGESSLVDLIDISAEPHTGQFFADAAVYSPRSAGINSRKINAIISDEASSPLEKSS